MARIDHRLGRLTVHVTGYLDMRTAPILEAVVDRHLHAAHATTTPGTTALVIDLRALTFIDAAGLSTLLRYSRHGVDPGCTVTLTRLPRQCRRLMKVTGTTAYFHIDPGNHGNHGNHSNTGNTGTPGTSGPVDDVGAGCRSAPAAGAA